MFWRSIIYIPYCIEKVLCDHTLYVINTKTNISPQKLWLYLNSTLFYITVELVCRRLGGGGGASEILVEDYEMIPVPDLSNISIISPIVNLQNRKPLPYHHVKQLDRRELDKAVLRALGFPEHELDILVDELHKAFVWVVEDRLIKAGRPLKGLEEEDYGEDN
jgi:hypothetical protein